MMDVDSVIQWPPEEPKKVQPIPLCMYITDYGREHCDTEVSTDTVYCGNCHTQFITSYCDKHLTLWVLHTVCSTCKAMPLERHKSLTRRTPRR